MNKSKSLMACLPLFLVIFIDGMGLSLVIPILNNIIVNPASDFLSFGVSASSRTFIYGLVVGIFMLCWFFGAAILGDLSDKIGRKKALIICLLGSFIGYSLAAFALMINSLTLLIIGRIIAGFTSGSQPIAQAAIVGISAKNHLARNIGLIILSVSLGFALGPFIGGVLSDPTIFAAFNFSTPLIFAAIISILNAVFLFFAFKETYKASGKWQVRLGHAVSIFISAFKNERIRHLSLVFFIMMVGWSGYFTFISAFMLQRYQITPFEVSMYLGVMGCGFAVGCGVLVGYFTKRFALKKIVVVASLLTALSVFLTVAIESTWVPWVLTFCIGMTNATAYSVILAIFSSQVSATEQGWVMGVTGSIMALCFGVTSILTGFLSSYGIGIPMIISAIGLALSAVVMAMLNVSDQSSQLEVPAS